VASPGDKTAPLPGGFFHEGPGGVIMFSCDVAMAEISSQYTGLEMTTRAGKRVVLRNLLLLGDKGLKQAQKLISSFQDARADGLRQMEQLRDLLMLLADDQAALREEISDWPLAMYVRVLDEWREVTEMGEAQGSAS